MPRLLDPFRSNRVFCGQHLAWKEPPSSSKSAAGPEAHPSKQMVCWCMLCSHHLLGWQSMDTWQHACLHVQQVLHTLYSADLALWLSYTMPKLVCCMEDLFCMHLAPHSQASTCISTVVNRDFTSMQVVSYMLGLPVNLTQEQQLPESDSDEEELNDRINRLWRPSLRPMVKSYSHASM